MSVINTNVVDYLTKIETLTNTNLQILKTLNDSFFTKKNHLYAEVDDTTYVIPSFISLENKINMLQENFENLVKAPETGEAYFNFDGNTRAIEVRKYSHVPDSIKLPTVNSFSVESNDIFKDFLTPIPYINLDLPKLPNDIVEVNVKKIVARTEGLKSLFKNKLSYTNNEIDVDGNPVVHYNVSTNALFSDVYKILLNYNEDYDYVEYDTIYKLPIRENIGTSTYVIESVISDEIDDDLNEFITLKLRSDLKNDSLNNKLTYKLFNETIEKNLKVGDELINFDGTGKVVITDIRPSYNTITVKVVNGEYLNFLGTDKYDTNNDTDIHDLSKLRFYSSIDFDADKYLKIPLEEDQFVFIAVAPLNSRMNVQGSWGTGIILDTYGLKNNDETFKHYYSNNVKNIGDVLFEMTSMVTSPVSKLTQEDFKLITTIKPEFESDCVSVMQINKHLNNSTTVKNIRDAYNQKKVAEGKLNEVQTKINDINEQLTNISFDDTNKLRTVYTAQLNQLNLEKNSLLTDINNSINSITTNVNASEIPIENAKYRIRGFYVPNLLNINNIDINSHVIGIEVQYRYKNISSNLGNAVSINSVDGNSTYIYSDWNVLNTINKSKIATCVDDNYIYKYEDSNENINEPSYNQIDIPISQGETVDIRLKVIYDYGQPYIKVTSDWSDIINIKFPDEFTKDIPILTIIEENNNDIETNRFNNILEINGINSHINDSITEQNITYFHKPDNISSGFYTDERKIIPLKDKLLSIVNDIALLKNDIYGGDNLCRVSLSIGDDNTVIYQDRDNTITLESYSNFFELENNKILNSGSYVFKDGIVSTTINISIANVGDTALKLYSIFPGNRNVPLNNTLATLYNKNNYCSGEKSGVLFKYINGNDESVLQSQNQFITFRINDVWTGTKYYDSDALIDTINVQNFNNIGKINATDNLGMVIYPYVSTKYGLCIDSDSSKSYVVINPGEELIVPIHCEYIAKQPNTAIEKTISFDLRTSLYTDPINYSFKVIGKNSASVQDELTLMNKKRLFDRLVNPLKYNHTLK